VQERLEREGSLKPTALTGRSPSSSLAIDGDSSHGAASVNAGIAERLQGIFVVEGTAQPSGMSSRIQTSSLLFLRPAVETRTKTADTSLSAVSAVSEASRDDTSAASFAAKSPSSALRVVVPMMVLELLSEASDQGRGWQLNLELTRYSADPTATQALFHITRAGHVSCA
jgi:hypothetical protein